MRLLIKAFIRGYQIIVSPFLPQSCRFYPTCSAYALEAVERFGALKGGVLATKRVCKCHPFYRGDMIDPVPDKEFD